MEQDKILDFLKSDKSEDMDYLFTEAFSIRQKTIGNRVYLRGLIEFSNFCTLDCLYCGVRRSNHKVMRYKLSREEIISLALLAYEQGFQSLALQSGEIRSDTHIDWLADLVYEIKKMTSQGQNPGLGITLSVGELDYYQYKKLYDAGAHRYLLRIETSNPRLFARIHPPGQSFEKRREALYALKEIGYQVGTGVMIGLPYQTYEDLLSDLEFFIKMDIDMLGMGPYIPHPDTPLFKEIEHIKIDPYTSSLKMISLARILMPDINIVASTALQTIHPEGLKNGLKAGANIVMPVLTPEENRLHYTLYAGKKYTPFSQLIAEIKNSGFEVGLWQYGDSPHFFKRQKSQIQVKGG
ncbi:biotin synthase [Thermosyntropha lipolytica DSM 11003]|uniref:Biotin synthase n=1 Tax=Thermosyntropha lipolytica DSM 11003 TaxID=1123382 RepID=A0A1M5N216_9FIRM|nr:[FeFe] hydrogenase H-cluster radical SAM maturase HydE [Thermosyntropha lipolytica]SHG83571.1 biotin synthase [Thermosyntropha lipolytica DSM 11003]